MIAARDKAGVYFGGVEHIATFLEVIIHELHRLLAADGAAEVVGSEDNHRSLETRFWNVDFTHSEKFVGMPICCYLVFLGSQRPIDVPHCRSGWGSEEEGIDGFSPKVDR